MSTNERVFVGLGSNLGDSHAYLEKAFVRLASLATSLPQCSSVYRSRAWGDVAQADFLNAVVAMQTALEPVVLLRVLQGIERDAGRRTSSRWGPRCLDLDLLAFGRRRLCQPQLKLPHPWITQRAFVLVPWAEIAADFDLVGQGRVGALCQRCAGLDSVCWVAPPLAVQAGAGSQYTGNL